MSVLKATPRVINTGIKDESRKPIVIEKEALPQHLPLVPLLTQRGPTEPQVVIGDGFNQMYGIESVNLLGRFATHQTVLATTVMSRANKIMVARMRPHDAKTAMLRLSVEVIPYEVPVFQRNSDGTFKTDATGARLPVTAVPSGGGAAAPVFIIGHRLVWHAGNPNAWVAPTGADADTRTYANATNVANFRLGSVTANGEKLSNLRTSGDPINGPYVTSTLYPIMDLEVDSFGDYGNNVGFGLHPANALHEIPGDAPLMSSLKTYLYRVFCGERPSANATPIIIDSVAGEQTQDLTFKENVLNPLTGKSLNFNKRFVPAYQSLDDASVQPLYGLFGRTHLYKTQLETVLALLADGQVTVNVNNTSIGEGDYDATAAAYGRTPDLAFTGNVANYQLLNIFTGVDHNGVPYWAFDVTGSVKFGGIAFGAGVLHYATGGSDGLVINTDGRPNSLANLAIYDELVSTEMKNFGNLAVKYLNSAKYPISTIWDSGFTAATKLDLLVPMARRKDVYTVLATHRVADYTDPLVPVVEEFLYKPQNTGGEETDFAASLNSRALLYPESEIFGTPVCRVAIVGHSGHLLNSVVDGWLPLTIDLADKVAKYMGNSNGKWASGSSFNPEPGNQVTLFRDINLTYKTPTVYNKDWDNGLIWVQSSDRRSFYYPAFQTVYPDDTSVLNSLVTVQACCELTKVGESVHRSLTGDDTLTDAQFLERSDQLITDRANTNRFDNRFVIVPETSLTEADKQRGFTWSTKIHIYANNMRTVNTMTVVTHRLSDLSATA